MSLFKSRSCTSIWYRQSWHSSNLGITQMSVVDEASSSFCTFIAFVSIAAVGEGRNCAAVLVHCLGIPGWEVPIRDPAPVSVRSLLCRMMHGAVSPPRMLLPGGWNKRRLHLGTKPCCTGSAGTQDTGTGPGWHLSPLPAGSGTGGGQSGQCPEPQLLHYS